MCITSGKFFQLLQKIRKTLVIVLLVVVIKIYFQFIFDKHVTHHRTHMTPFCLLFSSHIHTSNKTPPLSETSLYSWSEYTNQGPLEGYRPCSQNLLFRQAWNWLVLSAGRTDTSSGWEGVGATTMATTVCVLNASSPLHPPSHSLMTVPL